MPCWLPYLNSCRNWVEIKPKFKNFCAHQIANNQTIVFSPEKAQKVHSRPKLWPWAQFLTKSKSFQKLGFKIFEKGHFIPSLSYGQSKFGPQLGENCYVFTPIRHFFWLSLFSLPQCVLFLVISFRTPPQ